jgi:hypothetical protein
MYTIEELAHVVENGLVSKGDVGTIILTEVPKLINKAVREETQIFLDLLKDDPLHGGIPRKNLVTIYEEKLGFQVSEEKVESISDDLADNKE